MNQNKKEEVINKIIVGLNSEIKRAEIEVSDNLKDILYKTYNLGYNEGKEEERINDIW